MSLRDRTIPVFVYPTELIFYIANQVTHKQLLTLYNPYDFPVKYQVFANTTDRYGVVDPKGTIAAHSYVDLLVRHNAPTQSNCHTRDKFMITMQDATTNQILGKRCVLATLLPGDKDSSIDESSHSSYTACESSPVRERTRTNEPEASVKQYFIALSVVFIIVLLLPTKCDEREESSIPAYLHIAVPIKVIVSYVLGLITLALLKPC
ncbi:motile sperm domain-containing protein 1-like [Asbolus verrucosus]|uniref:Motile sperm domain-containing protein 1-like n=1 Tax=Asbolus verrucosus TaxID=1661398 RepID=A0A482VK68_ASBVE|nr:motile sperm domain-containing protein 1-like [Asbolus verrucosus]